MARPRNTVGYILVAAREIVSVEKYKGKGKGIPVPGRGGP
jgi:hypothetical protein